MVFVNDWKILTPELRQYGKQAAITNKIHYEDVLVIATEWSLASNPIVRHHPTEPAYVERYKKDKITKTYKELWFFLGKLHRDNGLPAVTCYQLSNSDSIYSQEWIVDGKRHRVDGPADDYPNEQQFALYGVHLTEQEHTDFLKMPIDAMLIELSKRSDDKLYFAELIRPFDPRIANNLSFAARIL